MREVRLLPEEVRPDNLSRRSCALSAGSRGVGTSTGGLAIRLAVASAIRDDGLREDPPLIEVTIEAALLPGVEVCWTTGGAGSI